MLFIKNVDQALAEDLFLVMILIIEKLVEKKISNLLLKYFTLELIGMVGIDIKFIYCERKTIKSLKIKVQLFSNTSFFSLPLVLLICKTLVCGLK